MSLYQKSNVSIRVKQPDSIASNNKRYTIFLTTTLLMLCGIVVISGLAL